MGILKFKGSWREYQKRILDDLNHHLSDNKIHVVAAPGAGKTTLGIEVLSRINKPSLILAPTITIKEQWKNRIITSFLEDNGEDLISTDILEPKFITIITYQALLAAFTGKQDSNNEEQIDADEEDITSNKRFIFSKANNVIEILKNAKIDVLCFDEAHHLRKEWWKALDYLVENLNVGQSISLTATPPYDSDSKEWERYETLCGPIDEVISIPELVQNKDLCPHQDFIHFSLMRDFETEEMKNCIKNLNSLFVSLYNNIELSKILTRILNIETEENILENPKQYVSLAIFLKTAKRSVSSRFLDLLYIKENELPKFNLEFQKEFLSFINGYENFSTDDRKIIDPILADARELAIIKNKQVMLLDSPSIKRKLANSLGKIDSIKKIVNLESNSLKEALRMVILADYIKEDDDNVSALGVVPIWQALKEKSGIPLSVLTGTLVLIPKNIEENFLNLIKEKECQNDISISVYSKDENYLKLTSKTTKKSLLTELVTEMFSKGYITVLIGTQALLGEGWDAPCINSLILSSTVSSYMLSNQMRGRAIRIDKNCPDKISNIWHLASIKILNLKEIAENTFNSAGNQNAESINQLSDYYQLQKRFMGYQAPSFFAPYTIKSGIERILPDSLTKKIDLMAPLSEKDFIEINKIMENAALKREETKKHWEHGKSEVEKQSARTLKDGIEEHIKKEDFLIYENGFRTKLIQTAIKLFGIFAFFTYMFVKSSNSFKPVIYSILLYPVILFILMYKTIMLYLKCSSPEKWIKEIGSIIYETYYSMRKIRTPIERAEIFADVNSTDNTVFFSVQNISPEENNLIVKSLLEFLNPIENPKYLLKRDDSLFKTLKTSDYHQIPSQIGQNAKFVQLFKDIWESRIGACETIYTRNKEGRRILLYARRNSYSSLMQTQKAKQMSRFE